MNIDLFKRACDWPDSQPVMLIGEGSFHQVHGGTTTNVSPEEQSRRVDAYLEQYRSLHGCDLEASKRRLSFLATSPPRRRTCNGSIGPETRLSPIQRKFAG